MRIIHHKPPVWPLIRIFFPTVQWEKVIITYGSDIYCLGDIPQHLKVHEGTHITQQKESKIYGLWWWIKYVLSTKFRYSQEIEAYGNQLSYAWRKLPSHQYLQLKEGILRDISGPMYNNMVTREEAWKDLEKCI